LDFQDSSGFPLVELSGEPCAIAGAFGSGVRNVVPSHFDCGMAITVEEPEQFRAGSALLLCDCKLSRLFTPPVPLLISVRNEHSRTYGFDRTCWFGGVD
jgi:hypothetical protein